MLKAHSYQVIEAFASSSEQSMCMGLPMRVVCCQGGPWLGCHHLFDCNMECVGGNNKCLILMHIQWCAWLCYVCLCGGY